MWPISAFGPSRHPAFGSNESIADLLRRWANSWCPSTGCVSGSFWFMNFRKMDRILRITASPPVGRRRIREPLGGLPGGRLEASRNRQN